MFYNELLMFKFVYKLFVGEYMYMDYRRVICFRMSYVFVSTTFRRFRLHTRTLWHVFLFLYLEQQHHYNLIYLKHIQRRFLKTLEQIK